MPTLAETMALLKGAKNKFGRNTGKTVTLKEGKTKVRVLRGDNPQFWAEVGQHWIKADEKGKPLAVVGSRSVCYDEPCQVGEAIETAIMSATDDDAIKLYKTWRARKFVLVPALILDGPDAGPEPQILQLSNGPFHDFLAVAETYGEAGKDVFDPKDGIDVVFERRGKGLDTEYTVMAAPVSKPFDPAVLKRLPDIAAFVEKEYFRQGDDRKAMTAIGSITGISFSAPALAPPRPATAGALTGAAAKLAELSSTAAEVPAPAPAPKAAPKPAPVVEEEDEDEKAMRLMQEKIAAKKAAKAKAEAEAAAAAAPAPAAEPAKGEFGADLDVDDIEATLAELDGI